MNFVSNEIHDLSSVDKLSNVSPVDADGLGEGLGSGALKLHQVLSSNETSDIVPVDSYGSRKGRLSKRLEVLEIFSGDKGLDVIPIDSNWSWYSFVSKALKVHKTELPVHIVDVDDDLFVLVQFTSVELLSKPFHERVGLIDGFIGSDSVGIGVDGS